MSFASTVFQLNKSTATILPKDLNIPLGSKLTFEPKRSQIILHVQEPKISKETPEELVKRLAGGFKGGRDFTPEEINQIIDKSYEIYQ